MQDPLQRLYKTKLAFVSWLAIVLGLALFSLGNWADSHFHGPWLSLIHEVGSALFPVGLVGLLFEYFNRSVGDELADERLRKLLQEEAPAFRDAVIDGFAFAPDTLTAVASPETLDKVIQNSLGIRLGDAELAQDVYADLREQVLRAPERWYDAQASVALAPSDYEGLFVATVRWEYKTTLSTSVLRFACLSDLAEYRQLTQDPTLTAGWYFEPAAGLDGASPEAYQLLDVAVDGQRQKARRTTKKGSQVYTVSLGSDIPADRQVVTLAYTYRALVEADGHLLHLDLVRPTKNFKAQLWYGNCGIRRVACLDYIAGAKRPVTARSSASDPTPFVEVTYNGWVFPKGGVAFVWVLDSEMTVISPTAEN